MCRKMVELEAQEDLMDFMISNFALLEPDTRQTLTEELVGKAYPNYKGTGKGTGVDRWWETPAKGLKRIK